MLQTEYSLWTREPETDVLPVCRELGISLVAYSPLGRGFLTGIFKKPEDLATDDLRRYMPRFKGENFSRNLQLVEKISKIAMEKNCIHRLGQASPHWPQRIQRPMNSASGKLPGGRR